MASWRDKPYRKMTPEPVRPRTVWALVALLVLLLIANLGHQGGVW